jgi:hypothetical protein
VARQRLRWRARWQTLARSRQGWTSTPSHGELRCPGSCRTIHLSSESAGWPACAAAAGVWVTHMPEPKPGPARHRTVSFAARFLQQSHASSW